MGTVFEILAYSDAREQASRVIDEALAEVARLETLFSSFDARSEVSQINRSGCLNRCRLSSELYGIIERSLEFSRLSSGRFDVTVGRLTRLYRESGEEGVPPRAKDLEEARRSVGFRNLVLIPPDGLLTARRGIEIDLGGIGKGFAVDRAAQVLLAGGLKRALINAGGSSILALNGPDEEDAWIVRLKETGREIRLSDRALSTSSQPRAAGINDKRYKGHIFNPRTGEPAEFGVSVSILCDSATTADALSTTCLLMGERRSRRILSRFKNVTMIWTTAEGSSSTFTTEI